MRVPLRGSCLSEANSKHQNRLYLNVEFRSKVSMPTATQRSGLFSYSCVLEVEIKTPCRPLPVLATAQPGSPGGLPVAASLAGLGGLCESLPERFGQGCTPVPTGKPVQVPVPPGQPWAPVCHPEPLAVPAPEWLFSPSPPPLSHPRGHSHPDCSPPPLPPSHPVPFSRDQLNFLCSPFGRLPSHHFSASLARLVPGSRQQTTLVFRACISSFRRVFSGTTSTRASPFGVDSWSETLAQLNRAAHRFPTSPNRIVDFCVNRRIALQTLHRSLPPSKGCCVVPSERPSTLDPESSRPLDFLAHPHRLLSTTARDTAATTSLSFSKDCFLEFIDRGQSRLADKAFLPAFASLENTAPTLNRRLASCYNPSAAG